ncbi:hypothetical protein N7457_007568 [Penicillium paradoxum]|uniref:uncharacterized protein n=1 Tax=Penicillium paradoxum TaxID=176176 RepID=UPI00254970B4|nr:uncharacterized protein N7457_007568 [Penicillium paradoxum]KAJ5779848.1 hypothetical protein N7457_007568 [Penicillium paradoxum]
MDSQIDIPAVAKHYNIRNNTAQMRLTRLKKKLEAMEDSANSENKTNDPKVMDEDPDNDDVLIKDEDLEEDYDVTQIEEQTYDDTELEEQAEVKSESE